MNQLLEFLTSLLDPLEVALLLTAFMISTTDSIAQVIQYYRWQSILLASVTGLTAIIKVIEGGSDSFSIAPLIGFIIILPAALAVAIKRILIRATVATPGLTDSQQMEQAEQEWLKYSASSKARMRDRLSFVLLVTAAFLIAFQITAGDFLPSDRIGLTVSLALHLLGLYNMVFARDTISQVIGLLVMDHGLYLTVVKIVAIPAPAGFFVLSLYFYTLITLFILLYLLPRVRHITRSIDLAEIAQKSELKG